MKFIKNIKNRIHKWYLGKHSGFSIDGGLAKPGYIKRPWLAIIFNFVKREYKWVIGVLIALLMAYLVYRR